MYHIKEDKRVQTSVMLITEGLERLMEKQTLDEITITDLQNEAGIGRATFYRLFDNKEDVLRYQCDRILAGLIECWKDEPQEHRVDWLYAALCAWTRYPRLLQAIVTQGREHIIMDTHIRMAPAVLQIFSIDHTESGEGFVVMLASMLIGTLSSWVKSGMQMEIKVLSAQVRKNYSALAPLFRT